MRSTVITEDQLDDLHRRCGNAMQNQAYLYLKSLQKVLLRDKEIIEQHDGIVTKEQLLEYVDEQIRRIQYCLDENESENPLARAARLMVEKQEKVSQ